MLLAGLEPEEESPIVFLRLRKAARTRRSAGAVDRAVRHPRPDQDVRHADPHRTRWRSGGARRPRPRTTLLTQPGAVILVGERLAAVARSALCGKHDWRRRPAPGWAGSRGAPATAAHWRRARCRTCCPAGDPSRMRRRASRPPPPGTSPTLPATAGRDTAGILAAAAAGELGALLIGGVELADLPDPDAALAAIEAAPFVVSLELRESAVTELADVVFPVAPVVEKAGSFVNWEGRIRPFEPALPSNATPDLRVLVHARRRDRRRPRPAGRGGRRRGAGPARLVGRGAAGAPDVSAGGPPQPGTRARRCWRAGGCCWTPGGCRTASRYLAGTARTPVARLSAATAAEIGVAEGEFGDRGHRQRARSHCRWRSPTWTTGWCGCR